MKLANLLTESKTKKIITEASANAFQFMGRIDGWNLHELFFYKKADLFNLANDWRLIRLFKMPTMLSPEELEAALADCDRNIRLASLLVDMTNEIKNQLQSLSSNAAAIGVGEKEYAGRQITAQHIADFLESIFITDKANKKRIFELYNKHITGHKWADGTPTYGDSSQDKLKLKSPNELVGRTSIRQGGKDIVFVFTRSGGEPLSEWALEDSVLRFIKEEYPEVRPLLMIRKREWSSIVKKTFLVTVKKASIANNAATNRNWSTIFIKYADWLAD